MLDKSAFRGSSTWKKKRKAILDRDDHKCLICGSNTDLQVHHILSISTHPQLRLDDNNLISVCTQCHENIHNNLYSQIYLTNLINK
nr:MAG TPA: NinG recombination protein [Caudoviricetes sp.]